MTPSGTQPAELGFFVALATAGSLSAAARNLGITTPAVSKRLAQMEARIGMPLVTRTTRRMSLTPEGEVFLEHARRILGEIDDLDQLLRARLKIPRRCGVKAGCGKKKIESVRRSWLGRPSVTRAT
ncbi:LysR family transcriptional regulator [Ralstonia solanacearum]|nr:LysR family transcriptional regulator [Ralstonia solanacearum]NJZ79851.1 LysR family transcriptional regulator [Ralstonia solanacearum]NKF81289.1 LysR family transcriptional regulator [Ralstonia solanacearum]